MTVNFLLSYLTIAEMNLTNPVHISKSRHSTGERVRYCPLCSALGSHRCSKYSSYHLSSIILISFSLMETWDKYQNAWIFHRFNTKNNSNISYKDAGLILQLCNFFNYHTIVFVSKSLCESSVSLLMTKLLHLW